MHDRIQIVGLGEVLLDIFEDGTATLGGAPLNVAVHVNQLLKALQLGEGVVVSSIGRDEWGYQVQCALRDHAMSSKYLTVTEEPTGTSLVFERQDEVGFEICKRAAWDSLEASDATRSLARTCTAVTFGSLAQRCPQSCMMIQDFIRNTNAIRLYDVNLRRNTTDGEEGYSKAIIESSCRLADYVKMNITELAEIGWLFGFDVASVPQEGSTFRLMEQIRKEFALTGVIVTRGKNGALYQDAVEQLSMPTCDLQIDTVHPVGAGDAFSAGILFGLSSAWPMAVSLQLAQKMGGWIAQHVSATPPLSHKIIAFARDPIV
jgi:fructokinase